MRNFKVVSNKLTRGGSPTPLDVRDLKEGGVERIISLDEETGSKIKRACKLLGIEHILIPLISSDKSTLNHLNRHNIQELFNKDSFVHCRRGKDRTGLLVAMYRCAIDGWDCKKALKEAKLFGFGTGTSEDFERHSTKIIQGCCQHDHEEDENALVDIWSGLDYMNREYTDNTYDPMNHQTIGPYADINVRQHPYALVHKPFDEQYHSRETLDLDLKGIYTGEKLDQMPQVGIYDVNTQGISGVGPSMIGSGFV